METSNDEHTKGKNLHKYVYIRENNGNICFCASNREF